MTSTMIAVRAVRKSYADVAALQDVEFDVAAGEIFGLIGPDGAGKTTLIRLIATLLKPTAGTITIDGLDSVRDFKPIRDRLGYVPGRFSLYADLTVRENLQFFAKVFGTTVQRNYDLIRDIYGQIEPFRDRPAGKLSGGMKQKLALSCALVHRPRLLLLDEPTTGVDPVSRREFWDVLARLKKEGITIFVSTPYMDEAGRSDRVALIDRGGILAIDAPHGIVAGFRGTLFAVFGRERLRLLADLRRFPHARAVYPFGEAIHVADDRAAAAAGDLQGHLHRTGHGEARVEHVEPAIEDRFIELMAHAA